MFSELLLVRPKCICGRGTPRTLLGKLTVLRQAL